MDSSSANLVPNASSANGFELQIEDRRFPVPISLDTATISVPSAHRGRWTRLLKPLPVGTLKLISHLLLCDEVTRSLYLQIYNAGRPASVVDRMTPGLRDLPPNVWSCIDDLNVNQRRDLAATLDLATLEVRSKCEGLSVSCLSYTGSSC